jgi:hypothetical protein
MFTVDSASYVSTFQTKLSNTQITSWLHTNSTRDYLLPDQKRDVVVVFWATVYRLLELYVESHKLGPQSLPLKYWDSPEGGH